MKITTIKEELNSLAYHGRGIIIGKSADGKKAITAYFIMGRSENSRNRVFVEDGEGIRTTVFFKGCPLNCVWCHNPESISFEPQTAFYQNKCIGCGACFSICPHKAISVFSFSGISTLSSKSCKYLASREILNLFI